MAHFQGKPINNFFGASMVHAKQIDIRKVASDGEHIITGICDLMLNPSTQILRKLDVHTGPNRRALDRIESKLHHAPRIKFISHVLVNISLNEADNF